MARSKFKNNRDKRDGNQFVALPRVVLESPGYRQAGHPARSLLIDIATPDQRHAVTSPLRIRRQTAHP